MDFTMDVENIFTDMVKWRRHMHQNPELSFQEFETTAFILKYLNDWGIEAKITSHGSGVIATIYGECDSGDRSIGGDKRPMVALRADMDALPIQDEKKVEYASLVPDVMHACGHDGHTASLLGVAYILQSNRSALQGDVRLLFQHAEEACPGGAVKMIEEHGMEGVDVIYGVHLWTPLQVGTTSSSAGAIMAAADEFEIEIQGKGGHGGFPHETVDSILVGSQMVVNLQSIVSRKVNPSEACVVSVGSIHAGHSFNVIPDTCKINGTVRSFNQELREQVKEQLYQIVQHTCEMHNADVKIHYQMGYPPVVNHEKEYQRFTQVASKLSCFKEVEQSPLIMAGEDFSYYLHQTAGCFVFVGAGNTLQEIDAFHHHPKFDIDENAMKHATELLLAMTVDYLESVSK